jgi:FKBP-type peptidyl-prolyl cis-trans isomerase
LKTLAILLAASLLLLPLSGSAQDEMAGLTYWNELEQEAITTDSGLQYKVLIAGDGRKPGPKSRVRVHYRGLLLNGMQFDSSWSSDEPLTFSLKRVIKGWTEGIQLMPEGSVYVFLIPPELAYGSRGSGLIAPDSTLIFEVELFEVK